MSGGGVGSVGEGMDGPFEFVGVPMLSGEGTGAFVPI
jgi:hypothetical protein